MRKDGGRIQGGEEMSQRKAKGIPVELKPQVEQILELLETVCTEPLGADFVAPCRDMATDLAHLRQSPLKTGRASSWACAIAYTVGDLNFLFDPSRRPKWRGADVCALFGVSQSATSPKSTQIRRALGLGPMDPRYWVPRLTPDNPFVWILSVNGLLMDIRQAPLAAQQEAYRKGLIPYVPAESDSAELRPPAPSASSDGTR